jgi:hypothetical protein
MGNSGMWRGLRCGVLAAVALSIVMAVRPSSATEPTEILGVKLGQPISLPECEKTDTGYKDFWLKQRCWIPSLNKKNTIDVLLTGEDREAFKFIYQRLFLVILQDGIVASVNIGTTGIDSQEVAFEALQKKYGKPTRFETAAMQNRMGAKFDVIRAMWRRPDAEIHFLGAAKTLDSGGIIVDTTAYARERIRSGETKPQF